MFYKNGLTQHILQQMFREMGPKETRNCLITLPEFMRMMVPVFKVQLLPYIDGVANMIVTLGKCENTFLTPKYFYQKAVDEIWNNH